MVNLSWVFRSKLSGNLKKRGSDESLGEIRYSKKTEGDKDEKEKNNVCISNNFIVVNY